MSRLHFKFCIASSLFFLTLSCARKIQVGGSETGDDSTLDSMNDAEVSTNGSNSLKVIAGHTYFKKNTNQSNTLPPNERCGLKQGDTLKYTGSISYVGVHLKLTLDDSSLPHCPFRSGYIFGQHFTSPPGKNNNGYLYPLASWAETCEEAGDGIGAFGALRDSGRRKHAGCDIYSNRGRPIYAVEDGVVLASYGFKCDTDALEVKGSKVIRYGEIIAGSPERHGVHNGDTVKKGQIIAEVGRLSCYSQAMLHFELFSGDAKGPLTDWDDKLFRRRSDLTNPTTLLKQWRNARFN